MSFHNYSWLRSDTAGDSRHHCIFGQARTRRRRHACNGPERPSSTGHADNFKISSKKLMSAHWPSIIQLPNHREGPRTWHQSCEVIFSTRIILGENSCPLLFPVHHPHILHLHRFSEVPAALVKSSIHDLKLSNPWRCPSHYNILLK